MSANEPGNLAHLPGSGEADNLDAAKQRAYEALVEAKRAVERIRELRSVPGLLGFPAALVEAAEALERLTMALGEVMLGNDNDIYRAYLEDRLASQVRSDNS